MQGNKHMCALYIALSVLAYPAFVGTDFMLERHYLNKNGTSKSAIAQKEVLVRAVEQTKAGM